MREPRKRRYEMLAIGLVMLTLGIVFWSINQHELSWTDSHREQALGRVVGHVPSTGDSDARWAPVVEFSSQAGASITFTSRLASPNPPAVGELIRVAYNPADPADAHLKGYDDQPPFSVLVYIPLLVGSAFALYYGFKHSVFGQRVKKKYVPVDVAPPSTPTPVK